MLLVCGGIFLEEIIGQRRLGGSGLTAALAAARHGVEVSLAGWVGAAEADEAFALLDGAGVDRLGVQVLQGATTTYRIADTADLSRAQPGLVQGAVPKRSRPALPSCAVVLCFGTPGFDVVRARWLDRAAEGATLLFDRQGPHSMVIGAAMAATIPAAQRVLLANVYEAFTETRQGSLAGALSRLPPENYSHTVLKAGPWGVVLRNATGSEEPFGAHEVSVRSTIGSGDVFAGVLAARIALGEQLPDAVRAATAAAAVWISGEEEHPGADLPRRAGAIAGSPAVWVDRRRLEALRFKAETDPSLEQRQRDHIGRGLRYVGIETAHTANDTLETIDLTTSPEEGGDPVALALTRAIQWAREAYGDLRQ